MPYSAFSVSTRAKIVARYPTIEDMYTMVEELEGVNYSINAERVAGLAVIDDTLRKAARLKDRVSETKRFPDSVILVDSNLPAFQTAIGQMRSALFLKTREKDKGVREGVDLQMSGYSDAQQAFVNGLAAVRSALAIEDNYLTRESFETKFSLAWTGPATGTATGGGGTAAS
jgi:hypothetical protein